jgi:hypothetical protein
MSKSQRLSEWQGAGQGSFFFLIFFCAGGDSDWSDQKQSFDPVDFLSA